MTDLRGQPGYTVADVRDITAVQTIFKKPKPYRGPVTVIVVEDREEAILAERDLKNERIRVMWPGSMSNSFRASAILISRALHDRILSDTYSPSVVTSQMAKLWWHETALCRLNPGALVITI